LVPPELRNPLYTTSYGLGELLKYVSARGANLVVLGLGGSATVDGGLGMLAALGANVIGASRIAFGDDLLRVSGLKLDELDAKTLATKIVVACDVTNPLLGERGAARAFGPQKGATVDVVEQLETGMARYAGMLCAASPRSLGDVSAVQRPGAGAAGGLGYALNVALGAEIRSGIDLVMDVMNFDERLRSVDVVITGEGRLDESSFEGKVVSGVLERARRQRKPVYVVAGSTTLTREEWKRRGITDVLTLREYARDQQDAERRTDELLATVTEMLVSRILA
jgi:glycerate kinase